MNGGYAIFAAQAWRPDVALNDDRRRAEGHGNVGSSVVKVQEGARWNE